MDEIVFVKTTLDGRRVEVVDGWVCLGGQREADEVVVLEEHPNRQRIREAVPLATHMAGRLPLTLAEASVAQAALRRQREAWDGSPRAVAERLRGVTWRKALAEGVE